VSACHLLTCDPGNAQDCPGSRCEKVCGPIEVAGSGSGVSDNSEVFEILALLLAVFLCCCCIAFGSWYFTSERFEATPEKDVEEGKGEVPVDPSIIPPPLPGWADRERISVLMKPSPPCQVCNGVRCRCSRSSPSGTQTPQSGPRSLAASSVSGRSHLPSGASTPAPSPPGSRPTTRPSSRIPSKERPTPVSSRAQSMPGSRDEPNKEQRNSLESQHEDHRLAYLRAVAKYRAELDAEKAEVPVDAPSRMRPWPHGKGSPSGVQSPNSADHALNSNWKSRNQAFGQKELAELTASLELVRISREREERSSRR